MGNIINSFISGFTNVISNLFGSPLDFLSGKSCSSVCGSTWDFICYIENFCVANLLKMAMVLVLSYIVLLLLYFLYKLGICECVGHTLCKMVWACLVSWFSFWEHCCIFLCDTLIMLMRRKRREHRKSDFSEFDTSEDDQDDDDSCRTMGRALSRQKRDYRRARIRKSLRPRSHRIQVGVSTDTGYGCRRNLIKHRHHVSTIHNVRVIHTSKFVRKRSYIRGKGHGRRSGRDTRRKTHVL